MLAIMATASGNQQHVGNYVGPVIRLRQAGGINSEALLPR